MASSTPSEDGSRRFSAALLDATSERIEQDAQELIEDIVLDNVPAVLELLGVVVEEVVFLLLANVILIFEILVVAIVVHAIVVDNVLFVLLEASTVPPASADLAPGNTAWHF